MIFIRAQATRNEGEKAINIQIRFGKGNQSQAELRSCISRRGAGAGLIASRDAAREHRVIFEAST